MAFVLRLDGTVRCKRGFCPSALSRIFGVLVESYRLDEVRHSSGIVGPAPPQHAPIIRFLSHNLPFNFSNPFNTQVSAQVLEVSKLMRR